MSLVDTWYRRYMQELSRGYAGAGQCHDLGHALRVAILAEYLAVSERRDARLCVIAALFHDIGHADAAAADTDDHEIRSARIAADVLGSVSSPADLRQIETAIEGRRFAKLGQPRSAVGEVLDDADNLDAMGMTGIARAYLWLAEHPQAGLTAQGGTLPVSVVTRRQFDALSRHWAEKLSLLAGRMRTATGRRQAVARHERMAFFLRESAGELRELGGYGEPGISPPGFAESMLRCGSPSSADGTSSLACGSSVVSQDQ